MKQHIDTFTTELLLIRHGQTDWNLEDKIQGQIDIPLNDHGHRQAQLVAQALATRDIEHVYASDLKRALSTAKAIGTIIQKPIISIAGLKEMHAGQAQGLTESQRDALYREWRQWLTKLPFKERAHHPEWPQGESKNQVFYRAHKSLIDIAHKHPHARVAVVTHSGVIHTLIGTLGHEEVAVPNCSVASFSYHFSPKDAFLSFNGVTLLLESQVTGKQEKTQPQL